MRVLFETLYDRFYDGWCIAARAYARAMKTAGAEVHLHSWLPLVSPTHPRVLAEVGDMMTPCEQKWDAYLWSGTFGGPGEGQLLALQKILLFRKRFETPVFFYTMFERTNVQPDLVPLVNELDGVIVPCSANLRALQAAGVTNAKFLPVPYFREKDPALDLERLPRAKDPPETFYWIGRWEPRKAPHKLIKAFLRAFRPEDGKRLLLKVGPVPWTRTPYALPEDVIAAEATKEGWDVELARSRIEIIRETLSPEQMVALHGRGDVYCSASHGEGIDMPAFAARLAGRRVVTTACGGPEDFVDLVPDGDVLVRARGTQLMPEYDAIWGPNSHAIAYEFEELVTALRIVAFDRSDRDAEQLAYSRAILTVRHSPMAVGNAIVDWFKEAT